MPEEGQVDLPRATMSLTTEQVKEIAAGHATPKLARLLALELLDARRGCKTWEDAAEQKTSEISMHIDYKLKLEGEVGRLQEWKSAVLGMVKRIPEYETGSWGGDKEGWGFVFELVKWQTSEVKRLRASLDTAEQERRDVVSVAARLAKKVGLSRRGKKNS